MVQKALLGTRRQHGYAILRRLPKGKGKGNCQAKPPSWSEGLKQGRAARTIGKKTARRLSCGSLRACKQIPAITYFRAKGTIIGPGGLTAVFGMGTGVTLLVRSPENRVQALCTHARAEIGSG